MSSSTTTLRIVPQDASEVERVADVKATRGETI